MRRKPSTTRRPSAAHRFAAGAPVAFVAAAMSLALGAPSPSHAALGRRAHAPARAAAVAPALRLVVVWGDRQSARAFAASTGPGYETPFAHPLVVGVDASRGSDAKHAATQRIVLRFACVSRGCRFAPSDQGDDVTRVSPQSYDVRVVEGRATLPPTLSTDEVPGNFVVRVAVSPRSNVRATGGAVFHLAVR